jgi:hypothetical protein
MDDLDVSYNLESEDQFWDGELSDGFFCSLRILTCANLPELDDILSSSSSAHAEIDNVLRSYLSFITSFRGMALVFFPVRSRDQLLITIA